MYVIIAIVAVLLLWVIVAYNSLIRFRTRAREAWADIEVQLKRRYDLIPNLVEAVKGYASHESGVFQKVTEARSRAMGAHGGKDQAEAENMLTGALKSLFAVSENYPQLRANENFLHLQQELTDAENKIQAARRFYNANIRDMNIRVETFPTNIIANLFKFKQGEFFDIDDESPAHEPVAVKF